MVFAEISSERAFFRLPALNVLGIPPFHAEVVELVDTLGSGSSEGSFMGVRVSPSAPFFKAVAVTCCDGFLFLFEAVE